jgi:3-hexulose-6-phosphate synthase
MTGNESRINLQIALDVGTTKQLLGIASQASQAIDWIEAGTPWILAEGMAPVRALRHAFPEKLIVADMKIMDGGYYEACLGFEAGADLVTVLGGASDATLDGAIRAARQHGKQVLVDLLQVPDLAERAKQATALGADYIGVHTAYDDQASGKNPLSALKALAGIKCAPLVVAGGLNLITLPQVVLYSLAAVVVGSALTGAADPRQMAADMRRILDERP